MTDKLKYRMYGLVPYNLSPIQQGIQFGHAVVEYMMDNYDCLNAGCVHDCNIWAEDDKTFIILNGGTTNSKIDDEGFSIGTLNQQHAWLVNNDVPHATFHEPDLNDALTAVVFLADERVWDYDKYPDFNKWLDPDSKGVYKSDQEPTALSLDFPDAWEKYLTEMGGESILDLRTFLKQFKLA
jgi:hypothetical protein